MSRINHQLINKEIINIIANYMYNRPFKTAGGESGKSEMGFRNINRPLDLYLRTYFNQRKYLGGSERSAVSDKVYNLVRYEYLLSHLIRSKPFDIEKEYTFTEQM